jgi:FlaA1/EpsC-like NDP-sugar epimerase
MRQVLSFNPKKIIILIETPLHHLRLETGSVISSTKIITTVADIRNKAALNKVYNLYKPQVYFTQRHKHVPLMEENPAQAILQC